MKPLGSQGPEISVVGFGAWEAGSDAWGPNPSDDLAVNAMTAAFDAGMTWIDTAEVYGRGKSEELVGRAVAGRDDVLVFTKLAPEPTGSGFSSAGVRRGAEQSLKRLGRDVIDLYQLHWRDWTVPVEETWGSMAELVDAGLTRWIGVSNFDKETIALCEGVAHVDCLQPQMSMLRREPQSSSLLEFCVANGTGVICYGPLAYGLLSGAVTSETTFPSGDWRSRGRGNAALFAPDALEGNLAVVDALRPIAGRLAISLAQLALAWVVHQNGVTGAIAGSRSPDHTIENAGAGDVHLDAEVLEEIEALL